MYKQSLLCRARLHSFMSLSSDETSALKHGNTISRDTRHLPTPNRTVAACRDRIIHGVVSRKYSTSHLQFIKQKMTYLTFTARHHSRANHSRRQLWGTGARAPVHFQLFIFFRSFQPHNSKFDSVSVPISKYQYCVY